MERRLRKLPDKLYFSALLPLAGKLPASIGYKLMRYWGRRMARSFPRHRALIIQNLRSARTHWAERVSDTAPAIADRFYEFLACEDLDLFYYRSWKRQGIRQTVSFEGLPHLQRALSGGRGALMVTGHFGSVCAAVVALALEGLSITHVARDYFGEQRLAGPFWQFGRYKVRLMEEMMGREFIYARLQGKNRGGASATLQIAEHLRRGGVVSMAMDALPDEVSETQPVHFLGRSCHFPSNFVRIASACQAPIVPFFTIRDPACWHRHRLVIEPEIPISGELSADLQACITRLENWVSRHPEQWFSWDSLGQWQRGGNVERPVQPEAFLLRPEHR